MAQAPSAPSVHAPLRVAASMLGGRRLVYWVGNGIWLTFAMSVASVYPFATGAGYATEVGLLHRVCFALSFFVLAFLVRRRRLTGSYACLLYTSSNLLGGGDNHKRGPLCQTGGRVRHYEGKGRSREGRCDGEFIKL